ncbi:hypothetical protein [Methanospirillum lacunae]|uniref:Uncharacterized protein n=1 Tax=Methanospirillum lacunae TaxID=668570 RepID=A0A2V2NC25_9EURY|nr:hypothetical protein [Methanospirillum lacunae]PWR74008.1 hypothetical protein DK846_02260 [Methanospirillum lacunae]
MTLQCEDGESVLKKTIAAVFFTLKVRHISKVYVTDRRIVIKNRKNEYIKISFDHIHEITVEDQYRLCIRCNTPQRFFTEREEYTRLYLHGLKKKEGGVIAPLEDAKWPDAWRRYLNSLVKKYQTAVAKKKREMQNQEEELLFIEGIQRRPNGLDPFAIVKTKEKVHVWFDDNELNVCTVYATSDHLLVKIKSSDYLVVPYSVIYNSGPEGKDRFCITFSFSQEIEGFSSPLLKMYIKRIPEPGEEYPAKVQERWMEGWQEFFNQVTSAFKAHKGAISHDEMLEMLVEMKHSPTKYSLSNYAKQGWDRACGLAVDRFGGMDDLYLFQTFLLKEYEDMKNRGVAEPDPARQEAYMGSEMAYNAILAYINQHTRSR